MDFKPIIINAKADSLQILISIVDNIRPGRLESSKFAEERIKELILFLQSDPVSNSIFKQHIFSLFLESSSIGLFTQSGIFVTGSFYSDLVQKLKHVILPPLYKENEMGDLLTSIFHKPWDHRWVNDVPVEIWKKLINQLGINLQMEPHGREMEEVLNSILILSHRIVVLGLDPILVAKIPDIEDLDSPFFQQNREISAYIDTIKSKIVLPDSGKVEYHHLLSTLENCIQKVYFVRVNKNVIGASLGLTYITQKLEQHIKRLQMLLKVLHEPTEIKEYTTITFFRELVCYQNTKNSLLRHFSANIGLLAYQVSEHAAKTGEHYISNDRSEYYKFLKYSMGGGVVVGFLVLIKIMIYHMHLPAFNEAFLNGLNYGIGFIIIHLCGFTLATKQPAMTASTLAGSLEGHTNDNIGISNLAQLIVKISRTQFVSFAGNLLMVFPTAWLLSWAFQVLMGVPIADPVKAAKLISELHPFYSFSIWYAAIAGVLLFIAGLISGYFDNKAVFNNIPARIIQHPAWKSISSKRREKIAFYIENNLGSLAGNFILGLLLASMAFFGFILGLPLDVRHVTFVTGNFGLALQSLDNSITNEVLLVTFISIVLIGFTNFIVSFCLAIFTAIRARSVKFKQTWKLLNLLKAYFLTYPLDFFFPPKVERKVNLLDDDK